MVNTSDNQTSRRASPASLLLAVVLMTGGLVGCAGNPSLPPIQTAEYVDLERFMGDWYVIASIPTFIEKHAYNAIETYELEEPGVIATTFTFNKGGPDGPRKTYHPTGYVYDTESNAIWGMQFIWPFKGDYKVVYVDPDYQHTIIGRSKRDYVWIMSRSPNISAADYSALKDIVARQKYDPEKLRRVPHDK
ncbi:MAG: hypothetical protein HKN70_14830 [Gammaproteobacteria bacterium]|nr:hypothetical protein [Gammaproteobacteria bacterium]